MANTNPHQGRKAATSKRLAVNDPGDIVRLQGKLWALLDNIDATLAEDTKITPENTRIVYAFTQVVGVYLKAREVGEIEARLAVLESELQYRGKA